MSVTALERRQRKIIKNLLDAINNITYVDSRGGRYPAFVEDYPINDFVDAEVAAAKAVLQPRRRTKRT